MRSIFPKLTKDLSDHFLGNDKGPEKILDKVATSAPFKIKTYAELINLIAELSFLNQDYLLYFRGQRADYKNKKNNKSTFFPEIYRDKLSKEKLEKKLEVLENASIMLKLFFEKEQFFGFKTLIRKKEIQWSILQHYKVCETPYLDLTQSIRVACSFAILSDDENERMLSKGYFYVFAIPYPTNRISVNSEEDLINIRLLSVCPPDALRPHYQEGYLLGTTDITNYFYDDVEKSELDFNRRLIAKLEFQNNDDFWASDLKRLNETDLFPNEDDKIFPICEKIKKYKNDGVLENPKERFEDKWKEFKICIENEEIKFKKAPIYFVNNSIIHETGTLSTIIKEITNNKSINKSTLLKYYIFIEELIEKLNAKRTTK